MKMMGPAWNLAAALVGLRGDQEMRVREDRTGCDATGRPCYEVSVREAGKRAGRHVLTLVLDRDAFRDMALSGGAP